MHPTNYPANNLANMRAFQTTFPSFLCNSTNPIPMECIPFIWVWRKHPMLTASCWWTVMPWVRQSHLHNLTFVTILNDGESVDVYAFHSIHTLLIRRQTVKPIRVLLIMTVYVFEQLTGDRLLEMLHFPWCFRDTFFSCLLTFSLSSGAKMFMCHMQRMNIWDK